MAQVRTWLTLVVSSGQEKTLQRTFCRMGSKAVEPVGYLQKIGRFPQEFILTFPVPAERVLWQANNIMCTTRRQSFTFLSTGSAVRMLLSIHAHGGFLLMREEFGRCMMTLGKTTTYNFKMFWDLHHYLSVCSPHDLKMLTFQPNSSLIGAINARSCLPRRINRQA